MATRHRGLSAVSRFFRSHTIPTMILVISLLTASGPAQQQASPVTNEPNRQAPSSNASEPADQEQGPITVPTQTQFALVLTHPIDSKSMRRGDEVYAQTTAPIAVADQVVIPAGTFVQGQVEKLSRNGSRGEFVMQSVSVLFPNGYVATVNGPMHIESDEGTAWRNPSNGAKAGALVALFAGPGLGMAAGAAAHTTQSSTLGGTTITTSTPKGLAIGGAVGAAAGIIVSVALLTRSRAFYVEVGSPMNMTLEQPLTLSANQVADALRQAESQPPPPIPIAPRPQFVPPPQSVDRGTCYTPGTPGTPPTIIPGTPAVGGSPGTPPIVIPGTPAIPGTPYPCP